MKRFPFLSLVCKLVSNQFQEYKYGLLGSHMNDVIKSKMVAQRKLKSENGQNSHPFLCTLKYSSYLLKTKLQLGYL